MPEKFDVSKKYDELGNIYRIDYCYGSRSSVFGDALNDGLITRDEYKQAQEYYGNLWNYVGD